VNPSFSRRGLRCVMVAFAAAAFAAPVAAAGHAPGEDPAATPPRHALNGAALQNSAATGWNASPLEVDRLGPKGVPLHHSLSITPVNVVKIVRPAGFDWADAAVGAAVSGLALALVAGLTMLVARRSRRPGLRERNELAGA
jgi:hypothetical protein